MTSTRLQLIAVLLALTVSTGCRTYGGYGSAELTTAKISQAIEAFTRSHDRAQAELEAFRRAAAANSGLEVFVDQYDQVVERHRRLVESYTHAAEAVGGLFQYSEANRLLGAIVSERDLIGRQYAEVVAGAAAALGVAALDDTRPVGTYENAPPFYERLRYSLNAPSLEVVLRAAG